MEKNPANLQLLQYLKKFLLVCQQLFVQIRFNGKNISITMLDFEN